MLNEWLSFKQRNTDNDKFLVVDFWENAVKKQDLLSFLKNAFLGYSIADEIISTSMRKYGWKATYTKLIEKSIPTIDKMKKGRFGEIIVCEILSDLLGYTIPVKKLQYQITANKSLPGTDAMALKLNNDEISEICFVESKLRTKKSNNPASVAYAQLKKDMNSETNDIMRLVLNSMANAKDPLRFRLLDFVMLPREKDTTILCIGLVCNPESWDDQYLTEVDTEVKENEDCLNIHLVQLKTLQNLIEDTYKEIGWEIIEDES